MSRKKDGFFEDIFTIVAKLPWQAALVLFLLTWLGWAVKIYLPSDPASAFKGLAKGIYALLFIAVGMGTVASLLSGFKRRRLLGRFNVGEISTQKDITWREFELLCQAYLEQQGYYTEGNVTQGADGGIDLKVYTGGDYFIVQAKLWAKPVGVKPIRELYGVQRAENAVGSIFMSWSGYTREAEVFAKSVGMKLIDEPQMRGLRKAMPHRVVSPAVVKPPAIPNCPKCSSVMVARIAKKGANVGSSFWGCSRFPKCRGVRSS